MRSERPPSERAPYLSLPAFIYRARSYGTESICDIELYRTDDGKTLVIATERKDNPGPSITNSYEDLASIVAQRYLLDPAKTVWVEHYDCDSYDHPHEETFDLVTLTWDGKRYRSPGWQQIQPVDLLDILEGERKEDR